MRRLYPALYLWVACAGSLCNLYAQDPGFRRISLKPEFTYSGGWLGGDGTLSVQLSDTTVLWIFSDSFVSGHPKARKRKKASDIVSNTIAISSFGEEQVHTDYFWRKSSGKQRAFFEPDSGDYRFWPVWAFLRNDSLFVLMDRVAARENPQPDDLFNFRIAGTSLAVVTDLEQEDPLQWKIRLVDYSGIYHDETLTQAGTDEHYLYGIRNFDRVNFLTRIPLDALLSPGGYVEYWSSEGVWKRGATGRDREILFTEQANGSLEYYPDLDSWIYIYGPNFLSNEIRYRVSREITGPWSEARVLYRTPEQTVGHPRYDSRHFCYLARAHSAFYDPRQRKWMITYDCNSTDFGHQIRTDDIYIPVVIVIDVPEEAEDLVH